MISDTITKKRGLPASTSDHWHVVHAEWSGKASERPFAQTIVSEHDTREAAEVKASALLGSLRGRMKDRPREHQDHVAVRPPRFRSLKARKSGHRAARK